MPITATQVAESKHHRALVTYLGQRDASPTVCDLGSDGPHVAAVDAGVRNALMDAFHEGSLTPSLWGDCVGRLVHSADRESARTLFDAVARAYKQALVDDSISRNASAEERLSTLQTLLLGRRGAAAPSDKVMNDLVAWLRDPRVQRTLQPRELRYAGELLADVEMEHGTLGGEPVDAAVLDRFFREGDTATLRQYSRRLPDQRLRTEALRRLIRLHIRASRAREVRENAAAVEETMLRFGANPVIVSQHRLARAWIDSSALVARGVLVRQDLLRETSSLLGYTDDAGAGVGPTAVSVFPRIPLRGALRIALDGIEDPITVCAPPDELDPTPCVQARDVSAESRVAQLDPDGSLRFVDQLTPSVAAELAETARRLSVPIAVGGRAVTALDWALRFETPNDLTIRGRRAGEDAPDLRVLVSRLETGRLLYDVVGGDRPHQAVIERAEAERFHVISKGADGAQGSDGFSGRDGSTGSSGTSASCPSSQGGNGGRGEDGSNGEDGDSGGAGGRGGDILVEVTDRGAGSDDLLALVRRTVLSVGGSGGAGGSGGRGGRGGSGGSGGSGTTCFDSDGHVTVLSGGSTGLSGSDGRSGSSGSPGSRGAAGKVTIRGR